MCRLDLKTSLDIGDGTSTLLIRLPIKYSSDSMSISGRQYSGHGPGYLEHEANRLNVVRKRN